MSESSPGDATPSQSNVNANPDQIYSGVPRRNRRGGRNHKPGGPRLERFEGKCEALKGHIYDIARGSLRQGETFQKTTREIAEYIGREFDEGGEFRTGLVRLELPALIEPVPPNRPSQDKVRFEMWKFEFARFKKESANRKRNEQKAYAIVLGQCSPAVRDMIEAHHDWRQVNDTSDVIGLLKLIQQAVVTKNTSKYEVHALVDAFHSFYSFRQGPSMSHSEYLDKFKDLVDVIIQCGSDIGCDKQQVKSYITNEWGADPEYLSEEDYNKAADACRERYLAVCLITKADKNRIGDLLIDVSNEYTRNPSSSTYPKTLTKAYELIINYKTRPHRSSVDTSIEGGLTFLNDGGGGHGNSRGSGRGNKGRGGRGYGGRGLGRGQRSASSHNNHTEEISDEAQFLLDSVNDLESDVEAYINTQIIESVLQQSNNKLPQGWLILDSASTICMFSDKQLLKGIHRVKKPIMVKCNAGITTTNMMGYFADLPEPVWYNPHGIANILSLARLKTYFHITYDSQQGNRFTVELLNGNTIHFDQSKNGLYILDLEKKGHVSHVWNMFTTVEEQKHKYTKRAIQQANMARKIQNIIGRPGIRQFMDIANKNLLPNCPITSADIRAAEDIYGPNLGSLKGKTVARPNQHTTTGVDEVPPEIMTIYHDVTIAIDILFINSIPFLATISRGLKFGTIEQLPNRQVTTLKSCLQKVLAIYQERGFNVNTVLADPEFEPLHAEFPGNLIHCCGADEHVPEIERYVRTIKDRVRSCYNMLPFERIPRIMLIHLVKNAVFWLNSFPALDGASQFLSPRYLLTGRRIQFDKHVRSEFGAYVQTHEQHDNSLQSRTTGAICLGPTGNAQGTHYFMSLNTGKLITRHRWTELPTPNDVITRVNTLGQTQNMPRTLTFADRYGHELHDDADEVDDDHDSAYQPDNYDDYTDDDTDNQPYDNDIDYDATAEAIVPENAPPMTLGPAGVNENNGSTGYEDEQSDDHDESEYDSDGEDGTISGPTDETSSNERDGNSEENTGVAQQQPRNHTYNLRERKARDYSHLYTMFTSGTCMITEQMNIKKGLKAFGKLGAEAVVTEMQQLHTRQVIKPVKSSTLSKDERSKALQYLMFLKQKRCGKVKARGCADGRKQRVYKNKEETSAPTVHTESLFLSSVIDAKERRKVITCDIPGAFMHADIDEIVHLKFEGPLAELMTRVDPDLYSEYIVEEKGSKVLYVILNKALYGTVQAAMLFWEELSSFLTNVLGFVTNPYDCCVVNKMIKGKQCTILWHVDDLKISHVDENVLEDIVSKLNAKYGRESPLSVQRGQIHEYLGMTLDYTTKGKVTFKMDDYISRLMAEVPEDMNGTATTPAANYLFQTNPDAKKLNNQTSELYQHLVAKLLYLCKRVRPDIMTAVAFLTTRVSSPDQDDYNKLSRCIKYLRGTKDLHLTLEADEQMTLKWWVDASFAIHRDMRSHTGATVTLGKGSLYSMSTKQKINTKSSTEAELVGVDDALPMVLWARHFLEAQGYEVQDNVVYQDNQSAILLERNGRASSGRRTRHINIRYFFASDCK